MLSIFKRHSRTCPQRGDRHYRRCLCVYWATGTVEGTYRRESLKTRSYDRALVLAREIEDGKIRKTVLVDATAAFIADARARGLRDSSIYKHELVLRRLKEFAISEGLKYLQDFDLDAFQRFRATLKHKNWAAKVTTANLRVFLRFCGEHGWTTVKPAGVTSPEVRSAPVEPFTESERVKILSACDAYEKLPNVVIPITTFVLVSRHTGLRVHDVVTLERKMAEGDTLRLQTEKTGTVVRLPLHPDCLAALQALPETSPYFFWSGHGESRTRVGNFQVVLRKVLKLAGVKGHHHRFRHTFACRLLESGIPIERVSRLMGHSDSRVTSSTYSAWIRERQDAAEADVRASWVGMKGT